MYNFEYKNPVKIIFGKGTISRIAGEIPKNSRVLILYGGGSIKRNGVYGQVIKALSGFDVFEFGGIEPNPLYETCMRAVEQIKKEKIDYLLAVGGGSVLDGTKFIAAAACYKDKDPWDFLTNPEIKPSETLPIGTVLTLPATGSEMNGTTVLSRTSTQEKLAFASPLLFPQFSVLDPECVFSLPDRQVANGIVDAFVHVLEQYLTFPANAPLQDRFSEGILLTLIEEAPKIMADRTDYNAAANFMWCATLALNGLIGAGVPQDWSSHKIGHELTAFHGIDHARTLSIVLPGVLHVMRSYKKEKLLQYGERIWGIYDGGTEQRIDLTIEKTVAFFESLGLPARLSDYGVGSETIEKIKERFKQRKIRFGERRSVDFKLVAEILETRL
jgi:NADP-dependent alcohol dehydrogenase